MNSKSVVIVGDNWSSREGLKLICNRLKLVVIGNGDDVASAFRACKHGHVADVVLFVDYKLESTAASAAALKRTRQIGPETIAVVVSDAHWTQDDETLLGSDIDAFLSLTLSCNMLVNALELILAGHRIFARPSFRHPSAHTSVPVLDNRDIGAALVTSIVMPAATNRKRIDRDWLGVAEEMAPITSVLTTSVWKTPPGHGAKPETSGIEPPLPRLSLRERQTLRCLIIGQPNKVIATELSVAETTVKVHVKSLLRKLKATNRTQAAIWAIKNSQLCGLNDIATGEIPDTLPQSNDSSMDEFDAELLRATV